jgi:geranylgeranyl diphosphate synthase type II
MINPVPAIAQLGETKNYTVSLCLPRSGGTSVVISKIVNKNQMKTFNEISQIIETELAAINWHREPYGLYAPVEYVLSLGGKRIRPALVLMGCNLFTDNVLPALKPAVGVEIFHNFTLLHDDIMDKAPVRRGKPTVHLKWNENAAILSGDLMQIEAYKYIAAAPQNVLKQVIDAFSQTAAEVCEGQQMDMDFEKRDSITEVEYLEMIRLKTAVLLGGALKIGAFVGNSEFDDIEQLEKFGTNIGMAFQLKDDLLDVYGDEQTFGKQIGGDILCNKKTLLLIYALELAKNADAEKLTELLNNHKDKFSPSEKISAVTDIYNKLKIRALCEEKMNFYFEQALKNLEEVKVENVKKTELLSLAKKLMCRID